MTKKDRKLLIVVGVLALVFLASQYYTGSAEQAIFERYDYTVSEPTERHPIGEREYTGYALVTLIDDTKLRVRCEIMGLQNGARVTVRRSGSEWYVADTR